MKRKSRVAAMILILTLMLMHVPASVFADGEDVQAEVIAEEIPEKKETAAAFTETTPGASAETVAADAPDLQKDTVQTGESAEVTEAPAAAPAEAPVSEFEESPAAAPAEAPAGEFAESPAAAPAEAPASEFAESPAAAPAEAPVSEFEESPAAAPAEAPASEFTQPPAAVLLEAGGLTDAPGTTVLQPISSLKTSVRKLSMMTGGSEEIALLPVCKTDDYSFVPEFIYDTDYLCYGYDDETKVLTITALDQAVKSTNFTIKDAVSGKSVKIPVAIGAPADTVTTTMKSLKVGLLKGKTASLKAAAAIEGSSVKPVSTAVEWESSDESVAAVDAKGKVTAKGLGLCTVTAKAQQGTGSLAFTVSVTPKLKSFALYDVNGKKLSKVTATVGGEPLPLADFIRGNSVVFEGVTAEEAAEYYTITYTTTAAPSVASVDAETGVMTLSGAGSAKVTATLTCGSQKKAAALTVSIGQAADVVTTTMSTEVSVIAGKTVTLKAAAAIEGSSAKPISTAVTWSSSDETVAAVDAKGKVTTKGLGSCTITAQAVSAAPEAQSLEFHVTVVPQMKSFTLYDGTEKLNRLVLSDEGSADFADYITIQSIEVSGNVAFTEEDYELSFVSSNPDAADFDGSVLYGSAKGTTKVTVTCVMGDVSKSVWVSVTVSGQTGKLIVTDRLEMKPGETKEVAIDASSGGEYVLCAESSSAAVSCCMIKTASATILQVNAVAAGSIDITISMKNTAQTRILDSKVLHVTVRSASMRVSPASASVEKDGTVKFTATYTVTPEGSYEIKYKVTNASVAAVSADVQNGASRDFTITGKLPGRTTVIVWIEDSGRNKLATATYTISVVGE